MAKTADRYSFDMQRHPRGDKEVAGGSLTVFAATPGLPINTIPPPKSWIPSSGLPSMASGGWSLFFADGPSFLRMVPLF